ncbi:FAD-binding oxidoreductase [Conexibacter woesei]|uniref:FAD linked oxidase domain protein n=1 Tax=Conexibacter woesei (strain DSM 14684 / CCUG 47730 / CIP 108061 / JCM 11494 / NBRC 100937 / ID131577) TaxID=469383 RepID=D3F7G9_CONWI|nr:FAD-binding oxidoreductase [Conexibacter woesei]ADB50831.1 FAD linked oxidase domain protein [Conexibacter woesei DSM 14684]
MTTGTATHTTLGDGSVAELAEALRGELIRPGDAAYDEARAIWNGAHDRRPALIVRCAGTADVIRAIEFARSEDLLVAIRGGGHSIPGFSTVDDGIVIDLSPMRGIRVDPAARTARAQPGVTWAELDHETQAFGLAVTGGLVSSTGIAGFTLGGGIGWLMRKHGLTCDNLIAADVVTADGQLVHASAVENEELFWGLRGGGGNFGVVTSFEYRLHPVGPTVLGGAIFYPGDRAEEILRFYREWVGSVPDELTTLVSLATAPPAPFLPEEWHGRRVVVIPALYAGPVQEGERAVRALRELGEPIADLLGPLPYSAQQSLLDALWGPGAHNYFKAGWMRGLDDAAIDTLVQHHESVTSPTTEIHVHHMGGAVARVPAGSTAFGDRSAPFLLNIAASTPTPDGFDAAVAWTQALHRAIEPALTGGTYVNFLSAEGEERVQAAYGADTYTRLAALKEAYDPANVFRLNQNIRPG